MYITIINDCFDENARGRIMSHTATLFDSPVTFVGVKNEVEAAGNIIDILDATEKKTGVILSNVAPRNGEAHKWQNGTPFAYFWYKNTLIVSSIDGLTLSLVKKLALTESIQVLDIHTSLTKAGYDDTTIKNISTSQFRSFTFLPKISKYIFDNKTVEAENYSLTKIPDIENTVWWTDNFGNAKTTLTSDMFRDKNNGDIIITSLGKLPFYRTLKDVPDDTAAIVIGSSGINDIRFAEIVIQGGSAKQKFSLTSGTSFTLS